MSRGVERVPVNLCHVWTVQYKSTFARTPPPVWLTELTALPPPLGGKKNYLKYFSKIRGVKPTHRTGRNRTGSDRRPNPLPPTS